MVFFHVGSHLVELSRKFVSAIEALPAHLYLTLAVAIPIPVWVVRGAYAVMLRYGRVVSASNAPNGFAGVRGVYDLEPCRMLAVQQHATYIFHINMPSLSMCPCMSRISSSPNPSC
jgi:hypothetical protein